RRMRAAATPTTVRNLMRMNDLVDVRDLLPAVRVPTLVLHRIGDRMNSIGSSRYLASRIPGARMVELPGEDHFPSWQPDDIVDPIEEFVEELPDTQTSPLALAAMVAVAGPDEFAERMAGELGTVRHTAEGTPVVLFDGP